MILIGTGSEVALCLKALELLAAERIAARVVSMPSWELFERQDEAYREASCRPRCRGAGRGRGRLPARLGAIYRRWRRDDRHAKLRRIGADQGLADESFGFTPEHIAEAAKAQIAKWKGCHESTARL